MKKFLKNWGIPIATAFVLTLGIKTFAFSFGLSNSDCMTEYPNGSRFGINKISRTYNIGDTVVVDVDNETLVRKISNINDDSIVLSNDVNSETITASTNNVIGKAFNF
ncbi:MAG: hypothetical protein ACLTDM_07095 [Clostridium butyricum]